MVCLGNICRSPIAEGILQHLSDERGLQWTVASAGTESYHVGEAPHRLSQKICWQQGIDISNQRARQFKKEDVAHYDKIYALAEDVLDEMKAIAGKDFDTAKIDLLMNELTVCANESVPDPYYGGEDGYVKVYQMIEEVCKAIVAKYG